MNIFNYNEYNSYFGNLIDEGCLELDENFVESYYQDQLYSGLSFNIWCNTYYEDDSFINGLYSYVNGRKHGLCREWHENANLAKEELYNNGRLEGYSREWDKNGSLIYEEIGLEGRVFYKRKKSYSKGGKIIEEFNESTLGRYVYRYKNYCKKKLVPYSLELELRFQDTCFEIEMFKIIDLFIAEERQDLGQLLKQMVAFSQEWFAKKDTLYKQFKRSIPIVNQSEAYDAIVSDIQYDDEKDFFTVNTLSEYQNGQKNGIELKWEISSSNKLHTLREMQQFKSGTQVSKQHFDI